MGIFMKRLPEELLYVHEFVHMAQEITRPDSWSGLRVKVSRHVPSFMIMGRDAAPMPQPVPLGAMAEEEARREGGWAGSSVPPTQA